MCTKGFHGNRNAQKYPECPLALLGLILTLSISVTSCVGKRAISSPEKLNSVQKPRQMALYAWDAREVDRLREQERGLDVHQTCAFWKKQAEVLPQGSKALPRTGMYAEKAAKEWCEESERVGKIEEAAALQEEKMAALKAEQDEARAQRETRREAHREELRAMILKEIADGKCSQESFSRYERGVFALEELLNNYRRHPSNLYEVESHQIVVVDREGKALDFSTVPTGTVHLFAAGYSKTEILVTNADGYQVGTESPVEPIVATALNAHVDGVAIKAERWPDSSITVKGMGCVLVVAVRQY